VWCESSGPDRSNLKQGTTELMTLALFTQDTPYIKNQLCATTEQGRTLAKIVLDSVSPDGVRLTTMEVVIPRIVLAEFNTHRVLSRNSASSRAIPIEKMLKRVNEDPYVPEIWTSNQPGMQGEVILDPQKIAAAKEAWLHARSLAMQQVNHLLNLGIHKQTTNRLLEPFMWHTVIVTATEWSNFFHLRCHPDAHPAIRNTAEAMRMIYEENKPQLVPIYDWHCPYVPLDEDLDEREAAKVSSARCARVSYLTHDGVRDVAKDIELHDRLLRAGHMSPFEHPAKVGHHGYDYDGFVGNFRKPWVQYRKTIPYEHDVYGDPERKSS
jgi:thymidylate synthase ThyX